MLIHRPLSSEVELRQSCCASSNRYMHHQSGNKTKKRMSFFFFGVKTPILFIFTYSLSSLLLPSFLPFSILGVQNQNSAESFQSTRIGRMRLNHPNRPPPNRTVTMLIHRPALNQIELQRALHVGRRDGCLNVLPAIGSLIIFTALQTLCHLNGIEASP